MTVKQIRGSEESPGREENTISHFRNFLHAQRKVGFRELRTFNIFCVTVHDVMTVRT